MQEQKSLPMQHHGGARPRAHRGERGEAGPLGLVAVFLATAIVVTVAMLFATGVAQRGILPRVQGRAMRSVPEPGTEPAPAQIGPDGGVAVSAGAPDTARETQSQATADSLAALKEQIALSRMTLEERVETIREEQNRLLDERAGADEEALRQVAQLAKIYSSMKPEAAARVMARLDDDTFMLVLAKLDKRQAAKVLSFIDPARVAHLTKLAATSATTRAQP